MTDRNTESLKYYSQLDGLRCFAVISVMIGHWISWQTKVEWIQSVPWGRGVVLFFVLSGYLISNILFSLKEKLLRKIKYYKNFIDFILNHNKTYFYDLDKVNDILLSTKVNKKNLAHHKEIIKVLFKLVNEQREKMYLLENDISNMEKELKTWSNLRKFSK